MHWGAAGLAWIWMGGAALAQTSLPQASLPQAPDAAPVTKLTLKADSALLYETNPLSASANAKPAWSRTHTFGAALDVPVWANVTWSASASTKFWRYVKFPSYDDNAVTLGSSLTAKFGQASLGLRYSHYGSYDPRFERRYELRDDVAAFANWRFEDKALGLSATPSLSLGERRANDHGLDRTRLSASLPVTQKFGAFSLTARLGATRDIYRLCRGLPCRRDTRLYAEAGASYEFGKNAEISAGVDFERSVSNIDGRGFNALTLFPKLGLSVGF